MAYFDLRVRVTPRASRSDIVLQPDGSLKVRVMAAPTEGQANEAVCELVAKALRLPKSRISIVRGESSRDKVLRLEGLDEAEMKQRLALLG